MKRAGLFDIRNIIGLLLLVYGVILLLVSFTTSEAEKARADGVNANLWMGIALTIVGILMIVWAVTRPIVIDEDALEADKRAVDEAAGRHHDDDGVVDDAAGRHHAEGGDDRPDQEGGLETVDHGHRQRRSAPDGVLGVRRGDRAEGGDAERTTDLL